MGLTCKNVHFSRTLNEHKTRLAGDWQFNSIRAFYMGLTQSSFPSGSGYGVKTIFCCPTFFGPTDISGWKTGSLKKWGVASKLESCYNFYRCLVGYMEPFMVWHHIDLFFLRCNFTFDATLHVEKYLQILGSILAPHFFAPQMFFDPTDISG